MNEKRFILKSDYDWWGVVDTTGEIKGEYNECFSTDIVVDLLNELATKCSKLEKENNKIKNILLNKRKDLEYAYNCAAKAGMPTGGTIGELDTIEEILEEIGLKND